MAHHYRIRSISIAFLFIRSLSKNESKDCAPLVAANEADAAIVEAHDLAGEAQSDT